MAPARCSTALSGGRGEGSQQASSLHTLVFWISSGLLSVELGGQNKPFSAICSPCLILTTIAAACLIKFQVYISFLLLVLVVSCFSIICRHPYLAPQ